MGVKHLIKRPRERIASGGHGIGTPLLSSDSCSDCNPRGDPIANRLNSLNSVMLDNYMLQLFHSLFWNCTSRPSSYFGRSPVERSGGSLVGAQVVRV